MTAATACQNAQMAFDQAFSLRVAQCSKPFRRLMATAVARYREVSFDPGRIRVSCCGDKQRPQLTGAAAARSVAARGL